MDNPGSILVKIFGCFAVRVYHSSIYVIVMENVFSGFDVQKMYDLKVRNLFFLVDSNLSF